MDRDLATLGVGAFLCFLFLRLLWKLRQQTHKSRSRGQHPQYPRPGTG
ncbi:hypothetical protein [Desulfurispira natronophila]|uniref:Uncharacterized protein n=1 Tax=Desulfurispira natronophila TaxID=682562 RepID=A0A7W7Y363_9BACT|nr:hypothetical protein [Desulfurispira natronophila]MBB5021251.1 hypothetical protein [Desulfurispira natronophila]